MIEATKIETGELLTRYVRLCDGRSGARMELEKLLKHRDVERVEIAERAFTVHTGTICLKDEGIDREIGRFRISLDDSGDVVIYNKTRILTQGYYIGNNSGVEYTVHHPHVYRADGRPCLGNLDYTIGTLISRRRYVTACIVLLEFLNQYNPRNHVGPIGRWPVAK